MSHLQATVEPTGTLGAVAAAAERAAKAKAKARAEARAETVVRDALSPRMPVVHQSLIASQRAIVPVQMIGIDPSFRNGHVVTGDR